MLVFVVFFLNQINLLCAACVINVSFCHFVTHEGSVLKTVMISETDRYVSPEKQNGHAS